jgi:hypothetical protein
MEIPDVFEEVASGHGLSLTQAARLRPPSRRGRPVNLSAVLPWVLDGVRRPDGLRVKLEAARLGGRGDDEGCHHALHGGADA